MSDRPVWTTKKIRAEDLVAYELREDVVETEGDVARDRFGKWDRVTELHFDGDDQRYVGVDFECGGNLQVRRINLVDVQTVKPS